MDRETLLRVWLPLLFGLYALFAIFLYAPGPRDALRWVGFCLCLIAFAGIILSRYTLGRSFSVRAKATALVTTGIYSRIRNPIYISSVIFFSGLILMVRLPRLAWVLVILIPLQVTRARREARVLEATFGDAYRRYRETTWF
jgi:protein-S-isoprenylcysteine O-methyltransferase Ste14